MKELLLFVLVFVFAYLFYLIFVIGRKKILQKFPEGTSAKYLKYKYGVKINDKNIKAIAHLTSLANSFILASGVSIFSLFDNFFIGIVIVIVPLVLLILIFYHLIGTYYKKKQGGK